MYTACIENVLPSVHTMCMFGLNGSGGTNPVEVFQCYRRAVNEHGLNSTGLQCLLETGQLDTVLGMSITIDSPESVECPHCCCVHDKNVSSCPNCHS